MAPHVNGPLHFVRLGDEGRPMVFVHPNPMDWSCWLYQMTHFSSWFRTMGIDLPGYGRSPTAEKGLTMLDLAQASWEAVDQVTDEPAILVGVSVGSGVVEYMAATRPERTSAVIVSGAGYRAVKRFALERMAQYTEQGTDFRWQHTLEDYSPTFRQTDLARYFATIFTQRNRWADAPTIVEMFNARGQPDPDWVFESIRAPMLVITGSQDNSHASAFDLQKRVAGCELIIMDGAGHACNMERPWEWDDHALRFLARHDLFEAAMLATPEARYARSDQAGLTFRTG